MVERDLAKVDVAGPTPVSRYLHYVEQRRLSDDAGVSWIPLISSDKRLFLEVTLCRMKGK